MRRCIRNTLFVGIMVTLTVVLVRVTLIQPLLVDYSFSQLVTDEQGKLLRLTLSLDDKYRVFVPLSKISPFLVEGTLLYEDEFFYWHFGVNPMALLRAFWKTYIQNARIQGASTITMQLAGKRYNINSRSITGKIYQILCAVYLELFYSKNDILEAYLNIAPYGFNIEGIGAASLIYLNKSSKRLKLLESISLAILPQSPTKRTYSLRTSPVLGKELMVFRKHLFNQWVKKHPQNINAAVDFNLPMSFRIPWKLPFSAPHVTTLLLADHPRQHIIQSSLDSSLQDLVERISKNYIKRKTDQGFKNTSVLLVDHGTMQAKAALGSVDFFNESISGQVNGITARRSPGSTLKPFVYGLAMDQGIIHPQSILKDAPTGFGTYNPENFDKRFAGPISATDALIHSRNLPAVQLAAQLEHPSFHRFLTEIGIPLKKDPDYYGLSIVLGSAEVSMVELAELYASLVRDGIHRPVQWTVTKTREWEGKQALSEEAAFLTLNMLTHNPPPENGIKDQWVLNKKTVAWKTGTSFGLRDAWAVGIFEQYILVVWIGNFSGTGNPAFVGRQAAGPLFFELIDAIIEQKELAADSFEPDSNLNIRKVKICGISGQIPNVFCDHQKNTWFIPEKSPIHQCRVHRSVEIDTLTGLRSCLRLDHPSHNAIYEFWPTHLLNLFKKAGLPRKTPPPFHPFCEQNQNVGIPPEITSPRENVEYSIRMRGRNARNIPLIAVADADTRKLKWFVNSKMVGTSDKDTPLIWSPSPGKFTVQVVDQLGRSDTKQIRVKQVK